MRRGSRVRAGWLLPLAILASAVALPARAQEPGRVYRVGFLGNASPQGQSASVAAFRQGLRDLGWVEGRNLVIEFRWVEGELSRQAALLSELIALRVDVILVGGTAATRAARSVTSTIPIVAAIFTDPVGLGFAQTFARPGGNITGIANQFDELIPKQMQLLKEAVPGARSVALLVHPTTPASVRQPTEAAARALGLSAQVLTVGDDGAFDAAFAAAARQRAGIVHVQPSPFFYHFRSRLAEVAARHRLPTMYETREYVEAGGLMSYGPSFPAMYARAASYVDRILRGARPGDLAIEQPTTLDFAVNLKAARAIGLTIPPAVLGRADHVIR